MEQNVVVNRYINEHLRWRLLKVMGLSALSSLVILVAATMLALCNLFYPFFWLGGFLNLISSLRFWFIGIVLVTSMIFLVLFNENKVSVTSLLHVRLLDHILYFVQPMNIIHNVIYCFVSAFTIWSAIHLANAYYHSTYYTNDNDDDNGDGGDAYEGVKNYDVDYDNGYKKLGLAMIIGFSIFVNHVNEDVFCLKFPDIQLPKWSRLRATIGNSTWRVAKVSFKWLLFIYPFNYFILEPLFMDITGVPGNMEQTESVVYQGYMRVYDVYLTYTMMVAVNLILLLPIRMHAIFLTEPLEFPIIQKLASDNARSMANVLKCRKDKLLQYLGILNLRLLSELNKTRRQELFSLSNPGFHPVYWQATVTEVLKDLESFVASINASLDKVSVSNVAATPSSFSSPFTNTNDNNSSFSKDMSLQQQQQQRRQQRTPQKNITGLKSPTTPSRLYSNNTPLYNNNNNLYNNTYNNTSVDNVVNTTTRLRNASEGFLRSPDIRINNDLDWLVEDGVNGGGSKVWIGNFRDVLLRKITDYLQGIWLVKYFTNESMEVKNLLMFREAQKFVWIVQSLSMLAAHSYTEDQYGVVQGSLATIVTSLLSLYEALNRPMPLAKPPSSSSSSSSLALTSSSLSSSTSFLSSSSSSSQKQVIQRECRMRIHLKQETKSALYRLVATFQSGLNHLDIPSEHHQKLQNFQEFKE